MCIFRETLITLLSPRSFSLGVLLAITFAPSARGQAAKDCEGYLDKDRPVIGSGGFLEETFRFLPVCGMKSDAPLKAVKGRDEDDKSLRLVTYNVQNLFDSTHDAGKDDYEFMPRVTVGPAGEYVSGPQEKFDHCQTVPAGSRAACLRDHWDEDGIQSKLDTLEKAVGGLFAHRPDILLVQEVENDGIVNRLASQLGYKGKAAAYTQEEEKLRAAGIDVCPLGQSSFVKVTESPDRRGIDVGLIYDAANRHLQYVSCREHALGDVLPFDSRNVLEVEFLVKGQHRLLVFVNHWPAQPTSEQLRVKVARFVGALADSRKAEDPDAYIVIAGDLNTLRDEKPNAVTDGLLAGAYRLHDLDADGVGTQPVRGSHYYAPAARWEALDRIIHSEARPDGTGLRIDAEDYRIHAKPMLLQKVCKRFVRDETVAEEYSELLDMPADRFTPATDRDIGPEVKNSFTRDSSLDSLYVVEPCAPVRHNPYYHNGYSDHFPVSAVIRF